MDNPQSGVPYMVEEKLKDRLTIGNVYHLFYRDRSSAKRERHAVVFLLEDETLCAMTSREYNGNIYRENVTGLRPGQTKSSEKKTLIMLSSEGTTVCLSLAKRSNEIVLDRGRKLASDVRCCLRMEKFVGEHEPFLIAYIGKQAKDPFANLYTKHTCIGSESDRTYYYPNKPSFSLFDENLDKASQLPLTEVILDMATDKGKRTVSLFKRICVFISDLLKKVFVRKN